MPLLAVCLQGWGLVCGDPGDGVGAVQRVPGVPVLAAGAGGGGSGLLHSLLGTHHRQRHVLCPAGQCPFLCHFLPVSPMWPAGSPETRVTILCAPSAMLCPVVVLGWELPDFCIFLIRCMVHPSLN